MGIRSRTKYALSIVGLACIVVAAFGGGNSYTAFIAFSNFADPAPTISNSASIIAELAINGAEAELTVDRGDSILLPIEITLASVVPNEELLTVYRGRYPEADVQDVLEEMAALWIRDFSSRPPEETQPHRLNAFLLATGVTIEPQWAPIALEPDSDGNYTQTITFSILPDQNLSQIGAAIVPSMLWGEPLGTLAIPGAEGARIFVQSDGLGFEIILQTPFDEIIKSILLYFGGSLLTLPGILAFVSEVRKRRAERGNAKAETADKLILPGDKRFSLPKHERD